jgi:tripartite-type tricarboxylate transporter receptor subunit TctC
MKLKTFSAFLALAAGLGASPALAQYPERPITYIVPYSAGSSSDISTRTWQPFMEECLGNDASIVVENHPGAGGALGFARLAAAAPDGYTMGNVTVPNMITAGFTQEVPWDQDSFEYIGGVIGNSSTLSVRNDSQFQTVQDFLDHAKNSSSQVNVGVGGIGGDDHIAAVQLIASTDVPLTAVPFGESALTRAALLGGHVETVILSNAETARFRDEIRPLAVASAERTPLLPDVPTFRELGLDFVAGSSHILAAPKGVPEDILAKWRTCLDEIVANPEVQAAITERSLPLRPMNAEEARAFVEESRTDLTQLWEESPWIKE